MDMLNNDSIRIIVKAPNQKIEDQTVDCMLDWTVKKLKTHLSDVYPSKPKTHHQKIIYSGKLLHDNVQLKDILRQDDGITHTVHLVCAPSAGQISASESSSSLSTNSIPSSTNSSYSELRYRSHPNNQNWYNLNTTPTHIPATFNFPTHYALPNFPTTTSTMTTEQTVWMHQMYNQYLQYYSQYVQQYSPPVYNVPHSEPIQAEPQIAQPNEAQANQNARNNRPANPNIRMNAQGGPVLDDDDEAEQNRDWYQDGWFRINRRQNANNNIINNRPNEDPAPEAAPQRRNTPPPPPPQPAAEEQNNLREGEEIENRMDADLENRDQPYRSPFIFAWTLVTSFFASLIPEQPQPVNAN